VKQLSSRWVITVLLVPVLLVLSILIASIDKLPQAEGANGKGFVQVAFTAIVNNQGYQNVSLNVLGVRFHESSDMTISEGDPGWQTVAVSPGATAGSIFPTLSFGGNFGPNGNAVGVGSARTEMQLDVAQLQNNLAVFNIGKINAINYKQVELLLDDVNPGSVTPVCSLATANGSAEGCISYPVQLAGGSSPRFAFDGGLLDVPRNATQIFPLAIDVVVGAAPVTSNDVVVITPNICPVPGLVGTTPLSCPFDAGSTTAVAAIVKGQIMGATGSGIVNAQLPGTGTIVSSAMVDKTKSRNFTMILPAGTYDFVAGSGNGRTTDAWSSVAVPAGTPSPMVFNVSNKGTRPVSGSVNDACSGAPISGAAVQVYAPPSHIGSTLINCASPSPAATPAACECDDFSIGRPTAGCVVIATSSTSMLGAYPFSPSGSTRNAFSSLPLIKGNYGLMATASGYNGELLSVKNKSETFKCQGSGYKDDACSFSLQHGTLQVAVDAGATTSRPLNVMLNAEDQGTFDGEGVQMLTIPAGQQTSLPAPILVPIAPTAAAEQIPAASTADLAAAEEGGGTLARAVKTTAAPTPTSTPVVIGGAASYDLFASVQDVFNKAPQKVGGHTIAVRSGVPAPAVNCATVPTRSTRTRC
jgi:hypothetical protein